MEELKPHGRERMRRKGVGKGEEEKKEGRRHTHIYTERQVRDTVEIL